MFCFCFNAIPKPAPRRRCSKRTGSLPCWDRPLAGTSREIGSLLPKLHGPHRNDVGTGRAKAGPASLPCSPRTEGPPFSASSPRAPCPGQGCTPAPRGVATPPPGLWGPPACRSASGVPPIAAADQASPVKTLLPKMSMRKGILPGCFSHTPRQLCQVLGGAVLRGGHLPSVGRAWELQPRLLGSQDDSQPATRQVRMPGAVRVTERPAAVKPQVPGPRQAGGRGRPTASQPCGHPSPVGRRVLLPQLPAL